MWAASFPFATVSFWKLRFVSPMPGNLVPQSALTDAFSRGRISVAIPQTYPPVVARASQYCLRTVLYPMGKGVSPSAYCPVTNRRAEFGLSVPIHHCSTNLLHHLCLL